MRRAAPRRSSNLACRRTSRRASISACRLAPWVLLALALPCLADPTAPAPAAAPALTGAAKPATPVKAPETPAVVLKARELVKQGKTQEAEQALLEALPTHGASVPILMPLADIFATDDRKEEAIELYGRVLTKLDPKYAEAAKRLKRLFYDGRFPRELSLSLLGVSPVAFTVDACRLAPEFHVSPDATRRFAFSTSLLFPEELTRNTHAPWIALPATGGQSASQMYNRVLYGLLDDPGSETLHTRWMLGYPSDTILTSGADYTDLASHIMHLLLRAHVYAEEYLAYDRLPAEGTLLRVFLTEEGPTGAEQSGDRIFIYDIDHDREPLEWYREVLHEAGHMLLPQVGPFEGDDKWGNGELGERLFLQWMLEEAGTVEKSPWPSDKARAAFDKLWRPCSGEASQYLVDHCRVPMGGWQNTEPESFEGKDALERFCAFCLWVEAANGRAALANALHTAKGTTPADFVAAYKGVVAQTLAKGAPLWVDAGALNMVSSKLAQAPQEGAVRREQIVLGEGGHANFRIYLPVGKWQLTPRIGSEARAHLSVRVDDAKVFVTEPNTALDLGDVTEGWHEITIKCGPPGPVQLLGLLIQGPQAEGDKGPAAQPGTGGAG